MKKDYLTTIGVFTFCFVFLVASTGFSMMKKEMMKMHKTMHKTMMNKKMHKKVDNFVIAIDMSGSMGWDYKPLNMKKSKATYEILDKMRNMIPNLNYKYFVYELSGNRAYVRGEQYCSEGLNNVVDALAPRLKNKSIFGPPTTIGNGILEIGKDLKDTKGKTAFIIFTDGGHSSGIYPVTAAKKLYDEHNGNICYHVVSFAQKDSEKMVVKGIADIGGCGSLIDAKDAMNWEKLESFVKNALYGEIMDSDGDGVADSLDWCPNTPKGVAVNQDGCPYDSDKDGVYDYMDKCPNTPMMYKVDNYGCPIPLKITAHINFKSNSANIQPIYYNILDKVGKLLVEHKHCKVKIAAHTDSVGSSEYNQKLSERRAKAVKDYLVKKFNIDPNRIIALGFGETMPIADNNTPEGRAENRRVEFLFSKLYEMR